MYIASYARKGRVNQLVLELTDTERAFVQGKRFHLVQSHDDHGRQIHFDEAEHGIAIFRRVLLPTHFPTFGKTKVVLTTDSTGTLCVRLPDTLKPLRKRRAKISPTLFDKIKRSIESWLHSAA